MVSSTHTVCSNGLFIAMVSAMVETYTQDLEIRTTLDKLCWILEYFVDITTLKEPVANGKADNLFITKSYNPSFTSR